MHSLSKFSCVVFQQIHDFLDADMRHIVHFSQLRSEMRLPRKRGSVYEDIDWFKLSIQSEFLLQSANIFSNSSFAMSFKLVSLLIGLTFLSNKRTGSQSEVIHKAISSLLLLYIFKINWLDLSRPNSLADRLHDFLLSGVFLRRTIDPENIFLLGQCLLYLEDQVSQVLDVYGGDYVVALSDVEQSSGVLGISLAKVEV